MDYCISKMFENINGSEKMWCYCFLFIFKRNEMFLILYVVNSFLVFFILVWMISENVNIFF